MRVVGEDQEPYLAMLNLRCVRVVQMDRKEFGDQGNGQTVCEFGRRQCKYGWVDHGDGVRRPMRALAAVSP